LVRDRRARLRRFGKLVELGFVLGLAMGYSVFYGVFPSSSVPTTGDVSFLWILAILIPVAFLVGLAADDVPLVMEACFVSLPIGVTISTLMGMSPGLAGLYLLAPDEIPFFLAHYGLAVIALAFVVNIACGFLGFLLREPFLRWTYQRRRMNAVGRK
jgi:hypothetical protein